MKAVRKIKAGKAASVEEASLKLAAESGDVVHPDDYKIVEDALKGKA